MSKYQNYNVRPAGESDSYDSDSDGFTFPDDDVRPRRRINAFNNQQNNYNAPIVEDFSSVHNKEALQAKRNLEFEVFKACTSGTKEIVEKYIKDGNDVNEFLHSGWTLLLYASSSVQPEIMRLVLDAGADPNKHADGYTPLMALCNASLTRNEDKTIECMHILIEANTDLGATNKNRETPLMLAVRCRNLDFVEELLKHNTASLDITDSEGNTVLHYAVIANKLEIVKLLLQHHADPTITNRRNMTAADIASTKQYENISDLFTPTNEEEYNVCETMNPMKWEDLFPDLSSLDEDKVLHDISTLLYGMGLERYKNIFQGMPLKIFLKLTEDDLARLGMDLSIHRKRFVEEMYKFHSHQWNPRSIGFYRSKTFSIFDGVLSLGNLVKKFCVIGASFNYIQQSIMSPGSDKLVLTQSQKEEYKCEILKTEEIVNSLQKEVTMFRNEAKKIKTETSSSFPATYITKKGQRLKWPIIIAIATILGFCLPKSYYVQRFLSVGLKQR